MDDQSDFARTEDLLVTYSNTTLSSKHIEHYHNTYEIDFFVKADINIFLKDRQYNITNGDILFINAYDIHKIIYTEYSDYERYVINIKKTYIDDVLKSLNITYVFNDLIRLSIKQIKTNLKERVLINELFHNILRDWTKISSFTDPIIEARLKMNVISLLVNMHRLTQNNDIPQTLNKSERQVKNIIEAIDKHYSEPITLDQLSQQFFLNKYYLSHIFKQVTGFTVIKYVQNKRIIEAQKMLRNTSHNILFIAHACGFNNAQHFCRVFKKISKTTPKKYRATSDSFRKAND